MGLRGHFRHRTKDPYLYQQREVDLGPAESLCTLHSPTMFASLARLGSLDSSPQDLIRSASEALRRRIPVIATLVRKSAVATKLPRNMKLAQHNSFVLIYCFSTLMCRYQMEVFGTVKIALSHGFSVRVAVCGKWF